MNDKNLAFLNKKIFVIGSDDNFLNNLENLFSYTGALSFFHRDVDKAVSEFKRNLNTFLNLIIIETKDKEDSSIILEILTRLRSVGMGNTPIILINNTNDEKGLADFNVTKSFKKEGLILTDLLKEAEKAILSGNIQENIIDISEEKPTILKDSEKEMRVLVVEDDPLLRNLLAIRLEKSKIPCKFSNDGNDALRDIEDYKPTLIILDLMLPEKDGFTVLKEIKSDAKLEKIPVIVFSNKDSDEDKKRAKDLGAKAFLVKAMTDLSDLVELIFDNH